MASDSAIWQVQSGAANGTEGLAGASNTVEFDDDPVTVGDGQIFRTEITLRNSIPENTSLSSGANDVEDMGPDGVDIQLTGIFKNGEADADKFVDWWLEDKTTTGYTKGRFGLRFGAWTKFSKDPVATYGYQIANPHFIIDGEKKKIIGFVVTLRLGGDVPNAF